ncbi:capsular polysaccharide biosynthesis protein CapA [Alkalihalobacillus alcalophilus ATCC 27647 = CGMCC 1.3604]|uniref:Capsular biosynthesis protein n=1 Tax=Alkalihalobacillus alcalophilus ATCC 27647 = CGMCC 1.3604 TaxID=1218173 RepID=A0A094WHA2_ALKAL|nr:CapA family protein [Alkalihalobacillus alcalophilus]KGA97164.1 capsular biosynthesis protein [Alkalihalobacillus alcalophilus ATCC 27647 = CGMCC 1.3604]MED1560904.1 CapA family protein [Alkalihalobacillus alcalophilus]THG89597.1 capsular polysaccharide biosynthesis protein CapA [Alkalihalobacillus alcalophilus ATCC 27647 = CGMCC 1.3604]
MQKKVVFFLSFIAVLLLGCQETISLSEDEQVTVPSNEQTESSIIEMDEEEEIVQKEEKTIVIGAIGDILLHERAYERAEVEDGYDFNPMLENVASMLAKPDFLMANQESIPGGIEIGLSTYPAFNSPQEIVRELQFYGVDMLIGANNHTLDRGVRAIELAIDYYDEIGIDYVGKYRDTEDRETDRIVDVEGIEIGVLAYTYGTNGIPVPDGHEDVVALIDEERIEQDVNALRKKVDILIVHMHWGDEYALEPNDEQRRLANELSEMGVDLIFGHHPHVLQPIDKIEQEDGHETIVFYSLGNFYSGQEFDYTDIGGLASVEVKKTTIGEETTFELNNYHIEPTLVLRQEYDYRVVPFAEAEHPSISGSTVEEMIDHTNLYLAESE